MQLDRVANHIKENFTPGLDSLNNHSQCSAWTYCLLPIAVSSLFTYKPSLVLLLNGSGRMAFHSVSAAPDYNLMEAVRL